MKKKRIWITWDLGINGDYEGLYTWLDKNGSKECAGDTAVLIFEYEHELVSDLIEDLTEEIQIRKNDRIYVTFTHDERTKGKFIIGRRKTPVWLGHAYLLEDDEDEFEEDEDE